MTEDPVLEALICEYHGTIWERRRSGSKSLPLFYIGAWDGFCEKCVREHLEAHIPPLKRVNYALEMPKEGFTERVASDWGGSIQIVDEEASNDNKSTREGVSRDDA